MKTAILMVILCYGVFCLFGENSDPGLTEAGVPVYLLQEPTSDSIQYTYGKLPYHESFLAGVKAADHEMDGLEWGLIGFLSGVSLNAVGSGIVYLSASALGTSHPMDIPEEYARKAFREGYAQRSLYINRRAALTGGAVGTALQVILLISFFSAISSLEDDDSYRSSTQALPAHPQLSLHFDY